MLFLSFFTYSHFETNFFLINLSIKAPIYFDFINNFKIQMIKIHQHPDSDDEFHRYNAGPLDESEQYEGGLV